MTEEGTGTWNTVGSQGWAQRQCSTELRIRGPEFNPPPCFQQLSDIGPVSHLPFLTLLYKHHKMMPASSEQIRLSRRNALGVRWRLNWQLKGAKDRQPSLSYFTLLTEGQEQNLSRNRPREPGLCRDQQQLCGSPWASRSRTAPNLAPCEGADRPALGPQSPTLSLGFPVEKTCQGQWAS